MIIDIIDRTALYYTVRSDKLINLKDAGSMHSMHREGNQSMTAYTVDDAGAGQYSLVGDPDESWLRHLCQAAV